MTKTNEYSFSIGVLVAVLGLVGFIEPAGSEEAVFRPEAVRREVNTDEYRLAIQKNGQIDLQLSDGSPLIDDAAPWVEFVDGKRHRLDIDYRHSERIAVRNALGQGNGFHFEGRDVVWGIATYPTQPFLTIDLTYINRTKKPVQVTRLTSLGLDGRKGAVHLGADPENLWVLEPPGPAETFASLLHETRDSPGHFGAWNAASGQVLVAGFATHRHAPGFLTLARSEKAAGNAMDLFRAERVFDPPVTVQPGEPLQADTLYLAIVERDPQEALERFAQASQRLEPYLEQSAPHGPLPKPVAPGPASLQDWALASRQYYLPPVGNPQLNGRAHAVTQDTSRFSDHQFITAWTLAALQGALLQPIEPETDLTPVRRHILSRLKPAPKANGRPLDLFQEGPPQRWVLPVETPVGAWTIVGLFNWDSTQPLTLDTPLPALGLNRENYYTVYDFWAGEFLGLIQERLQAEIPAEGVRLFGLRRFDKHPMLVASNRHYTQGASDHRALDWSYDTLVLSGSFEGVADTQYTLTVLIPEPYGFKTVESSVPVSEQRQQGSTLQFELKVDQAGPVSWQVACTYAPR